MQKLSLCASIKRVPYFFVLLTVNSRKNYALAIRYLNLTLCAHGKNTGRVFISYLEQQESVCTSKNTSDQENTYFRT